MVKPDEIGTHPPGSGGPFSPGVFLWAIPWFHKSAGTPGAGLEFTDVYHFQVMFGANGIETTFKAGAIRTRKP